MKNKTKNTVCVINVKSESGDDYGPYVFLERPTDDDLEKLLRKTAPDEWDDGCGWRGSYLRITIHEGCSVRSS